MPVALSAAARQLRSPAGTGHEIGVQVVGSQEAFDALRAEWNGLVDRLAFSSPFQSWEWNRTWWKHLGGNDALQIVVLRQCGVVIGIVPFYRKRYGVAGIGPAALIPIGSHHYKFGLTEHWEPLFPQKARCELFEALSTWLEQNRWSVVVLPGLQDSDLLPIPLVNRAVLVEHRVLQHTLDLPPSWEQFVGRLSKNLRKNIRRYPQRLLDDGYEFSFRVAETPEEVSAALPTFFELHRARAAAWADEMWVRHSDRFRFPNRRAFLREVAAVLAARGQFKLGLLKVGDKVAACETWLEKDDAMYLYHSGVAPKWAEYSLGFVTTLEVFKYAIARGIRRVELLRGEGHYKDRWRATPHTQRTVVLARHPKLAKMALALRNSQRQLRQRMRSGSASR